MSGFLYYLPGLTRGVRVEELRECGLGYAFSDAAGERSFTPIDVRNGPDGGNGVIVADDRNVKKVGFYKDEQTWRKMPESLVPQQSAIGNQQSAIIPRSSDRVVPWVGFYTDDRPAPPELARERVLNGHLVELNDGRQWLIPVARGYSDDEDNPGYYHTLPKLTALDDAGNWVADCVAPKYARLWDIACSFWDALSGAAGEDEQQDDMDFDFKGTNDAALFALQTNYRVGKLEVDLLGLFTDQATTQILLALVDGPTLTSWLKKKAEQSAKESPAAAG